MSLNEIVINLCGIDSVCGLTWGLHARHYQLSLLLLHSFRFIFHLWSFWCSFWLLRNLGRSISCVLWSRGSFALRDRFFLILDIFIKLALKELIQVQIASDIIGALVDDDALGLGGFSHWQLDLAWQVDLRTLVEVLLSQVGHLTTN